MCTYCFLSLTICSTDHIPFPDCEMISSCRHGYVGASNINGARSHPSFPHSSPGPSALHLESFISLSMGVPVCTLLVTLLATIPSRTLAGAHGIPPRSRDVVARQSTYTLQDWYQGQGFFSYVYVRLVPCHPRSDFTRGWSFSTGADPTNGNVNYLSEQDATSQRLAYVNTDNTLVLAIDSTSTVPAGGNRNS